MIGEAAASGLVDDRREHEDGRQRDQWYLDGGVHPIAQYVEEGMRPLRSIWSARVAASRRFAALGIQAFQASPPSAAAS